ncbi:hypothetical protein JW962_01565 [Candidatus Dojkabacteria bacterium]|nr:hypothetical protein [Candidatus Dojkabacteria bacterium]
MNCTKAAGGKNTKIKRLVALPLVREYVIRSIREYFFGQGFTEITVPVLSREVTLEPTIYTFQTTWDNGEGKKEDLYMLTSPETAIKKAFVRANTPNCFSIGHSFRNKEPASKRHNPEFLMLEWYRENADYTVVMKDCEQLVKYVQNRVAELNNGSDLSGIRFKFNWPIITMDEAFKKYAKISWLELADDKKMQKYCKTQGYNTKGANWEQLFNQVFLNKVEERLLTEHKQFILSDFPAILSPLCKPKKADPRIAERFEFFINGLELGNGATENFNADLVEENFKREAEYRKANNLPSHPWDKDFVESLRKFGNKKVAGVGLGVDRLAMLLAGKVNISDVLWFPLG